MQKEVPNFVLGSKKSSTYTIEVESCLGSSGWVGKNTYASGFFLPAASFDDGFEHSVKPSSGQLTRA